MARELIECGPSGYVESLSTPTTSFALIRGACSTVYRTKPRTVELIGERAFDRREGVCAVKIESLREVKANLSRIVKELPSERSVVITKNGRPCAILFPVTEDTDLESMVLAQNNEFWRLMDRAHKEGEKKGFTKLKDLPD
jgi:prevent-host-death family protein